MTTWPASKAVCLYVTLTPFDSRQNRIPRESSSSPSPSASCDTSPSSACRPPCVLTRLLGGSRVSARSVVAPALWRELARTGFPPLPAAPILDVVAPTLPLPSRAPPAVAGLPSRPRTSGDSQVGAIVWRFCDEPCLNDRGRGERDKGRQGGGGERDTHACKHICVHTDTYASIHPISDQGGQLTP